MKRIFSIVAAIAALAIVAVGCKKPSPTPTPAEDKVTLDQTELTLEVGATATLKATATADVVWSTSNDAVATVANGTVTAVAAGEATVTAQCGKASATCKVTVNAKQPEPSKGQEYVYKMDVTSNYYFNFEEKTSCPTFSVEWRFLSTKWNEDGMSNRLGCIGDAGEQGVMLRFNDDGGKHVGAEDWGLLQVCNKFTGNFYIGRNTSDAPESEQDGIACFKWMKDTWYTLTITGDGETLKVYANGEVVAEKAYGSLAKGASLDFEYYEQGMSWTDGGEHNSMTGYPYRQNFNGYLAYIRVWNKVLAESEIKANLCACDEKAEGLVCNWVFGEGEGSVIKNTTGNAKYDLDFSKGHYKQYTPVVDVDASEYAAAAWAEMNPCPDAE